MKTTSFFFALSFSVFAVTVPSCFSADQQYEECALPLRCGPGPMLLPNVTCPFWGVDKTQILRPNRVSTLLQEWSILNFRGWKRFPSGQLSRFEESNDNGC
uniref:Secreted protein n=1 Tax=Brassica oleracea var. oleracea TaxID=109376 RepID=A0A0D3CYJ3_BRAOL